jgi:Ribosomal protein L4/L1 family
VQVDNVLMSARNIEKLQVNFASAVRVYDVLRADKIVIEEEALAYLNVSLAILCPTLHNATAIGPLLSVAAYVCFETYAYFWMDSYHVAIDVQEFYA